MFDTNTTITLGPLRTSQGRTEITVRWPSNEEWAAHRKRSKLTMKQLGRGASELDTDTANADSKLYEAIKLNGAPPLSSSEAGVVVKAISRCEVVAIDLGAVEAEVDLHVLSGKVKHTLRIPTMDEVRKLQRTTRYITLPYNQQEVRTSLEAAADLWDACGGRAEGYAGEVPSLHKDVAIRSVINELEHEASAPYDEESF